jgi:hypothetical protein
MTGGLTEGTLRQMEYPDAEYVLKAFMEILPPRSGTTSSAA